jgi:hypothetical protein
LYRSPSVITPFWYRFRIFMTSFSASAMIRVLLEGVIRSSVANDRPLLVLQLNPIRFMSSSRSIVLRRPRVW